MTTIIRIFLDYIQVLKGMKLTYRQPGDGSDGTCDCIGLIIGALKRMGIRWSGIHGTNYTARREIVDLKKISSVAELEVGDWVLKAREPGHAKYALPDRYKKGKAYYNGDLKDYYHIGVVTQVNPLNITHMTSPTVKVDTKLDHNKSSVWSYYGKGKLLVQNSNGAIPVSVPEVKPVEEPIAQTGSTAVVTAQSGRYVKMRQMPSTSCRIWEEVPIGATVTLVKPGEEWAQISYGRYKGWYMMAKFLNVKGA